MARKQTKKPRPGGGRIFFGIVLLVVGAAWLVGNEIRNIKTLNSLKAASSWVEMENPAVPDPSLDGKFVHAVDSVTTPDILRDAEFGLSAHAIILKRKPEYYQLVESSTRYNDGDGSYTEYSYHRQWTDKPVDSGTFSDSDYRKKNFTLMTFEPWKAYASEVRFGGYILPAELYIRMENDYGDQHLSFVPVTSLNPDLWRRLNDAAVRGLGVEGDFVCLHEGRIFIGVDPLNPQIGDVRISYEGFLPSVCTVIAQVKKDTLVLMKPKGGIDFGGLFLGEKSAESFLEYEMSDNNAVAWGLRIWGLLHLLIGGILLHKGRKMRE